MGKKPLKDLTSEDRYLWKKVTDTVMPRKGLALDEDFLSADALIFQKIVENQILKSKRPKTPLSSAPPETVPHPPALGRTAKAPLPPIAHMNRKSKSRLARGLTEIDGRVDLHGLTQQQAHAALHTFIARARASGWKTVLVITGKGGRDAGGDPSGFPEYGREAPGVLRRKVPQWLADPALRPFILGYDTAAPIHGGNGALYVRLRKQNIWS